MAEACCDAQAFEVLVDYFAAQAYTVLGEEFFYFIFAIEHPLTLLPLKPAQCFHLIGLPIDGNCSRGP